MIVHIYAFMKLCHAKRVYSLKADQQRNLQRKAAPYFDSLGDVEYTTLKHRYELMIAQVLGEDYLKTPLYHNNLSWIPNKGE